MRKVKDRDFLRTLEGFLFCVVGYSHPRDRVISYLKYVPSGEGRWGREGERYARTMPNYTIPSLLSNIEMLRKNYPRYVFHSRVLNITMSAVPHNCVAERYLPEAKLKALLKTRELDPLQETAVELVSFLSRETGVPREDFGVTGSILTDIHNPRFSDIDLTVYGGANAWRVKETLKEVTGTHLSRPSKQQRRRTLERWVKDYPLTLSEAEAVYDRRWNYGLFKDRPFSIHAVRKDEETAERYGEKRYFPQEIIEGKAEITGIEESLFLPCMYRLEGLEVELGREAKKAEELVSYDGLYAGLFDRGERVSVRGKLEEVVNTKGDRYLRVLVGSPEARGRDYIKPSN